MIGICTWQSWCDWTFAFSSSLIKVANFLGNVIANLLIDQWALFSLFLNRDNFVDRLAGVVAVLKGLFDTNRIPWLSSAHILGNILVPHFCNDCTSFLKTAIHAPIKAANIFSIITVDVKLKKIVNYILLELLYIATQKIKVFYQSRWPAIWNAFPTFGPWLDPNLRTDQLFPDCMSIHQAGGGQDHQQK